MAKLPDPATGAGDYELREATLAEMKLFYCRAVMPKVKFHRGLFIKGRLVAVAGILPDPNYVNTLLEEEARTIGYFDTSEGLADAVSFDMVRRIRGFLKTIKHDVYVQHDDAFPKAEKLLRVLGFKPTGELRADLTNNSTRQLRIWKWQC